MISFLQPTINRQRPLRSSPGVPASEDAAQDDGDALTSRPRKTHANEALVWMAESAPLMDLTRGRAGSQENSRVVPRLSLGGAAVAQRPDTAGHIHHAVLGSVVEVAFFPWVCIAAYAVVFRIRVPGRYVNVLPCGRRTLVIHPLNIIFVLLLLYVDVLPFHRCKPLYSLSSVSESNIARLTNFILLLLIWTIYI